MARCIAVANQKGGSGKTTTARSLAAALAERLAMGQPTLVLDVATRSGYNPAEGQIPGSVRVLPDQVEGWAAREDRARAVVAYCT